MSRSSRKKSIRGVTTVDSEKQDKRRANRAYRRVSKVMLNKGKDVLPHLREVSNVWTFEKDGKQYFDPKRYPKLMRK